jgi:hypothetical protein
MAALRGYWRGRNKADNEKLDDKPGRNRGDKKERKIRQKFAAHYRGEED